MLVIVAHLASRCAGAHRRPDSRCRRGQLVPAQAPSAAAGGRRRARRWRCLHLPVLGRRDRQREPPLLPVTRAAARLTTFRSPPRISRTFTCCVNSASYWNEGGTDYSDGGPPCSTKFVDLKITEANLPWYFAFNVVPAVNAHARVTIQSLLRARGALPVAVPDIDPKVGRVFFIDETNGTVLASTPLTKQGFDQTTGLATWDNASAPASRLGQLGTDRRPGRPRGRLVDDVRREPRRVLRPRFFGRDRVCPRLFDRRFRGSTEPADRPRRHALQRQLPRPVFQRRRLVLDRRQCPSRLRRRAAERAARERFRRWRDRAATHIRRRPRQMDLDLRGRQLLHRCAGRRSDSRSR